MAKQEHLYQNYIVFDFETGGLNTDLNPAMEVAIVIVDGSSLKVIATYSSLIKRYSEHHVYDPKAMKYTGLTEEMCELEGKPVKTVVSEITEIIKNNSIRNAKYMPILVGHNILFDIKFLQQIFHFGKGKLESLITGEDNYFKQFTPHCFDTQRIAMAKYAQDPKITQHTLTACIENAGLELNDAHRALADTLITAELFTIYINNLRSEVGISTNIDAPSIRYFLFDE